MEKVYNTTFGLLRQYLLPHPWAMPLLLGLGLRLIAALCSAGWFASDDYIYVIAQGGRWLTDPHAVFTCNYRSVLFPRIFWCCLWLGQQVGLVQRLDVLRFAYALLGVWSVLAIPGVYCVARPLGQQTARLASYMMAAFSFVPHICTRALPEAACMVPLIWSIYALQTSRLTKPYMWASVAAILLGTATMLRFQVAVLLLPMLYIAWRTGYRAWLGFLSGSLIAAAIQSIIDILSGRLPLSTPWHYLTYNLHHASQFGTSPWYTYIMQFVLLTLPPATYWLIKPLFITAKKYSIVSLLFVVFVICHMLIAHKEDRFMFPILPLFFILLSGAFVYMYHKNTKRWIVWYTGVINTIALLIATISPTQHNLIEPLQLIAQTCTQQSTAINIATVGIPDMPDFYLPCKKNIISFGSVNDFLAHNQHVDYILSRAPLQQLDSRLCAQETIHQGSLIDQILVACNRHNNRRGPIIMRRC